MLWHKVGVHSAGPGAKLWSAAAPTRRARALPCLGSCHPLFAAWNASVAGDAAVGEAPQVLCSRFYHSYAVSQYTAMVLPQHCIRGQHGQACLPARTL